MRWIQYPTDNDRKNRTNGTEREGQLWADAPGGPRRKWVVPEGNNRGFALVVVYDGITARQPERNYALADWPGAL